ncbi:MAG: hypothetical protein KF773_24860, partial [Deltaproteobacteria bacterium]|nr:hypothetical protein [Deltaproteobacteria bacterium]
RATVPDFLMRAVANREHSTADRDRDVAEEVADDGNAFDDPKPNLLPFGLAASSGWPYTAVAVEHQERTAELEQQLGELRSQLVAATAARDAWRDWYRTTRVKAIADAIAVEAAALGADGQSAQAAAHAAAQAVASLPDDQLTRDDIAMPFAQHVGHGVGAAWAAAIRGGGHEGRNDLHRARDRRARGHRRLHR